MEEVEVSGVNNQFSRIERPNFSTQPNFYLQRRSTVIQIWALKLEKKI